MEKIKVLSDCRGMYEEDVIEHIFKSRGIEDFDKFLNPTEDDILPYQSLPNMDAAVDMLHQKIADNSKICTLADSDTDGISSGTIMTRYLHDLGIDADTFIDTGKSHGLDIREDYYQKLFDYDLVIIVDSLNSGIDEYKELAEYGVSIIILDHHEVNSEISYDKYATLVTSSTTYANHELSGAGVTWKFCKYYDIKYGKDFADQYLDLCASGLIADVMDMTVPENRYLVYRGLMSLNNLAMKKLVGSYEFNSTAVSYSVAPMVNAANRMSQNEAILHAFLTDDNKKVLSDLRVVKKARKEQNEKVDEEVPKAEEQFEAQKDNHVLFFQLEGISGLSGLIAQKLASKYNRPSIVVSPCDGMLKGSGRCPWDIPLMKMINDSGLAKAMGHPQSFGFEINFGANIDNFISTMNKQLDSIELDDSIVVDVAVNQGDLTFDLESKIHALDFVSGKGWKPITFLVEDIDNYEVTTMKDGKHLKLSTDSVDYIKWNSTYSVEEFEDASLMNIPITCIGTLSAGGWAYKKLQLICDHMIIQN